MSYNLSIHTNKHERPTACVIVPALKGCEAVGVRLPRQRGPEWDCVSTLWVCPCGRRAIAQEQLQKTRTQSAQPSGAPSENEDVLFPQRNWEAIGVRRLFGANSLADLSLQLLYIRFLERCVSHRVP